MIRSVATPTRNLRYDAAEATTRRRDTGTRIISADNLLTDQRRRRLQASARDLQANFSVAAWAIRRHLDYVTQFSFAPDTGDSKLNDQLTDLFRTWQTPESCEASHRFDLATVLRMAEARRTVDGDVFIVKLRNGRLQPIEADRIRSPKPKNQQEELTNVTHGIQTDQALRPRRYAVHDRLARGTYTFRRWIPAAHVLHLAYIDTFHQIRGVSPLTTAINPLRDLYEGWTYALAKMKVSQLFGLAIYRDMANEEDTIVPPADDGDEDQPIENSAKYDVDFGKGPLKLELDPGDRAEFLEAQSPATQFQDFSQALIGAAMKALDIPYSFWDEAHTNFYGSRASAMQYQRACVSKRAALQHMLNRITTWKILTWILDGKLLWPQNLPLDRVHWEWIPAGTPWWRPLEETKADIQAIQAGFKTHDQVVRQRQGHGFRQNIDAIAEEQAYAAEHGVTLATTAPYVQTEPPSNTNPETGEPK